MEPNNNLLEECEEEPLPLPIPVPIPTPSPITIPRPLSPTSKFNTFIQQVENRLSTPKNPKVAQPRSKIFDHQNQSIPDTYKNLVEATHKITARHLSQLRYYKETPKISESIALCFLLLIDLPIPKSHYWEQFVLFLARPGMFLQLLRHLPIYLEIACNQDALAKIFKIYSKIPKKELNLDPRFFELQLLLNILQEVLAAVKIPEILETPPRKVKIPSSAKARTLKSQDFFNEKEVLNSYDARVLEGAIDSEAKQLRVLKGKLSREEWNEKRWQKSEEKMENLRETEREIDIQRNTDSEFFKKIEKDRKEKKIVEGGFKSLAVAEIRNIKKNCKKLEILELARTAEENYASMVWDRQLAKAKEMQYRNEVQLQTKFNLEDRREYVKLENETLKMDQQKKRTDEVNNTLKMQYKSLLQEKEQVLKALSLYSSN